jgi:hypothetical protein
MKFITVRSLQSQGSTDTLHNTGPGKWVRRSKGHGLSRCEFYNEKRVPAGPARHIVLESDLADPVERTPSFGERLCQGFGEERWA